MSENSIIEVLTHLVEQAEGPYKWYVITAVALVLTAGITRYIFKTLKWFFIVIAMATLIFAALWYFADSANLTATPSSPAEIESTVGE